MPESFLKSFREARKKDVETHLQFHERLRIILNKWIHMVGIAQNFDALREAFIREQVMQAYQK